MPQMSPIGGLSLLVHVGVNLLVFTYKKFIKLFRIPKNNRVSRSLEMLYNKNGETTARKLLSYMIVTFVIVIISANAFIISTMLLNLNADGNKMVAQIVAPIVAVQDIELADLNAIRTNAISKNPLPQDLSSVSDASLVDFLRSLGIVNTSVENRRNIALKLGILDSKEKYNGSAKQNLELLIALKKNEDALLKTVTFNN